MIMIPGCWPVNNPAGDEMMNWHKEPDCGKWPTLACAHCKGMFSFNLKPFSLKRAQERFNKQYEFLKNSSSSRMTNCVNSGELVF